MQLKQILKFLPRLIVAVILLQTLYFKFTGSDESIYIFETMGMEPWGRYLTGILELIAGILLLIPGVYTLGALLALGVVTGAIFSHLTKLGIEVMGDGGLLFILAIVVFVLSLYILLANREQLAKFPIVRILAPKSV